MHGGAQVLRSAWHQLFTPHLTDAAPEVLAIAERHLRRARQLHLLANPDATNWDPVSLTRAAVSETNERPHDAMEVLVDAARDSLVHQVVHAPASGRPIREAWADALVPILQRLSIHAVTNENGATGTDKLDWLRKRPPLLVGAATNREVLELIQSAAPEAETQALDGLVDTVLKARTGVVEAEAQARVRMHLLGWINQHCPGHPATTEALNELRRRYPELEGLAEPRIQPRFIIKYGFGEPPMSPDEYHHLIADDPAAALAALTPYKDSQFPGDSPLGTPPLDWWLTPCGHTPLTDMSCSTPANRTAMWLQRSSRGGQALPSTRRTSSTSSIASRTLT
jgi:hypothetical protein